MFYPTAFVLLWFMLAGAHGVLGPLDAYRWENRIIIISAESPDDPAYKRQQQLLDEDGVEFKDRDLVSFHLFRNKGSGPAGRPLDRDQVIYLRQQYRLDENPFTIVLIGKDGTVKRKSHEPLDEASLYAQIDSMPMRKIEMRQKK